MAGHLLSFVSLSTLLLLFISLSHSMADNEVDKYKYPRKSKKVTFSLYYESLSPYCRNFIVNKMEEMFDTDLHTIVSLRMVPWGNAQTIGLYNETIICQVHKFQDLALKLIQKIFSDGLIIYIDLFHFISFFFCRTAQVNAT